MVKIKELNLTKAIILDKYDAEEGCDEGIVVSTSSVSREGEAVFIFDSQVITNSSTDKKKNNDNCRAIRSESPIQTLQWNDWRKEI